MLLRYCLSGFEMVAVVPAITGITFAFKLRMRSTSNVTILYLRILFTSLFITFLSIEIATSINTRSLFIITDFAVRFIVSDGSVGLHLLVP